MSDDTNDLKPCGPPRTLPASEPTTEWLPEQLSLYAQIQYRRIVEEETRLTRPYWRLGHALELAKRSFGYGQWAKYLEQLGIDPTRASKARAIYRTFAKEDDVARLTVEDAYARRARKRSTMPSDSDGSRKHGKCLRKSVTSIAQRTGAVIQEAAFAASEEAMILIPAVRKAIRELQTLLEFLERQAAETQANGSREVADA